MPDKLRGGTLRRNLMVRSLLVAMLLFSAGCSTKAVQNAAVPKSFDVVVVQGTPGGIMSAIGAARGGNSVLLLDRTQHVGGLPANGLGATDIATRGATGGLFKEFVDHNKNHYVSKYGVSSQQVKDSSDGYHFE